LGDPGVSNRPTYISTRGTAPVLGFDDVLLTGLARDGGLYVPQTWPSLTPVDVQGLAGLDYWQAATRILTPFVTGDVSENELAALARDAYAGFDHAAVAPLSQIGANEWILELYHGPTLAFKDLALQLVGRLFDLVLSKRGARITVVGATSGDTGSAAIEACRDRDNVDIFMLHPAGRVSEVQRRQMTTVQASNVHNIALDGTFDDCQAMVKALFADHELRDRLHLSAVNSINWARVAAQTVYYFTAAVSLGGPAREVAFSVPTGNFGDVYAGYVAAKMGLPVERLVIATNVNDILVRSLHSGRYEVAGVTPTMSPSMDIQVSSNFERLLFDLYGRDGKLISGLMSDLARSGAFDIDMGRVARDLGLFRAASVSEDETLETMAGIYRSTGSLIDPHTAVGIAAGRREPPEASVPMVYLATAHPAKFPDAVERATGARPALPARLADLLERPERFDRLANEIATVKHYIESRTRAS
jgi:threonine synthase